MVLKTKNKEVEMVYSTRQLVRITKLLGGKNFETLFFEAVTECNLEALSQLIFIFSVATDGRQAFKGSDEVYDFIDDYLSENKKTYEDLFREIAEDINKEGFFKKKMSKEELEETLSNPLSSQNLNDIVKTATEKAVQEIVKEEAFRGFKG